MKPSLCIIFLFLIHLSCSINLSYSQGPYNAIFTFGDSLSAAGDIKGITLPHGMTFFGKSTGRMSDGRIIIDFLAEAFGLPFPPSYLWPDGQSFTQGANFAVIGATALDMPVLEQKGLQGIFGTNFSLNVQLEWFEQLIPSLCATIQGCKEYFGQSLFVVGEFGGNDYMTPLVFRRLAPEQVKAYVPTVVDNIKNATERLIHRGAMNLVVPGNPPSGCFAGIITLLNGTEKADFEPRGGCLKVANDVIKYHNRLLRRAVRRLTMQYPGVRIIYADFYTPIIKFVRNPRLYGFSYAPLKACCGGGGPYNVKIEALCGRPGSSVCADPSSAMDWDGWHSTEATHRKIANYWLHGPHAYPPILGPIKAY